MSLNPRGFSPILILVILALIGVTGFIVFNSTTPTSYEDVDEPELWQTEQGREKLINAAGVYNSDKLSENERELLSNFYWPPLEPFSSDDTEREVYLVDCETINDPPWEKLTGIPEKVPNTPNIAEVVLKRLVDKHYGGFPDSNEIANYENISGSKYKNKDSGINGVLLKDGVLAVNFYDSVAAYGGGSARVSCMGLATSLTARQFQGINSVIMCIDKYPSEANDNCFYDFQP